MPRSVMPKIQVGDEEARVVLTVPYPTDNGAMWNTLLGTAIIQLIQSTQGQPITRLAFAITNSSAANMRLAFTASQLQGGGGYILLPGQTLSIDGWTGDLFAVAAVANSSVSLVEIFTPA